MSLSLRGLLKPHRIAIVGVSERPEATGSRVLANLRKMDFPGTIYPVNPRYETIAGLACYPSLSALPQPVDAAFLAVPAAAGPELLEEAGRCGIRAAFINANGYADGGEEGRALQSRLVDIAREYGIAVAGPNNTGLVNVHDRIAMWTPRYMKPMVPGPLAAISQSGSIALILSEDERDLGFAYVVTTGNEAVVGVADYLREMAQDDRVRVILLFLETIRDPATFAQAAREAARHGKRIVALKLGTTEQGRALVRAHTGALAGEDDLYDAFFKAHGILRVRDLDEMLETAALLCSHAEAPPAGKTVMVTLSGGEAALLADLGGELGLHFEQLSQPTLDRLRPAFAAYSSIGNPVDAWGLGFSEANFRIVLDALLADEEIAVLAFLVDAPGRGGGDVPYACIMARACAERKTGKRLVFVNNTSGSGVNADVRSLLDPAGIPYLSGMRPGLAALRNYVSGPRPSREAPPAGAAAGPLPTDEPSLFRLLRSCGVDMVAAESVASAAEAASAAERFGYPVVMKGVAPHLPHKTELGLVRLGLASPEEVAAAWGSLSDTLAAHAADGVRGDVVVQGLAPPGVELIVGMRNDRRLGSFIVVGPGGTLVEISRQASIRMAPVGEQEARAMLYETAAGRLLEGVRGRPACDIDAAAAAIAALSRFGAARLGTVAALEVNPLIVGERGARGVDLLIDLEDASSGTPA